MDQIVDGFCRLGVQISVSNSDNNPTSRPSCMEYGKKTCHLARTDSTMGMLQTIRYILYNILDTEHRKQTKYEALMKACKEKGWGTEFHHIAVWCQRHVDKKTVKTFGDRGFSKPKLNQMLK